MSKLFHVGVEKVTRFTSTITVEAASREEAQERVAAFLAEDDNSDCLEEAIHRNANWGDEHDIEFDQFYIFDEATKPSECHINAAGELVVDVAKAA